LSFIEGKDGGTVALAGTVVEKLDDPIEEILGRKLTLREQFPELDDPTYELLHRRVSAGIAFLDRVQPAWLTHFTKYTLELFDIASGKYCVLGITHGRYRSALDMHGKTHREAVHMGFCAFNMFERGEYGEQDYQDIQNRWGTLTNDNEEPLSDDEVDDPIRWHHLQKMWTIRLEELCGVYHFEGLA
jgi:hypothetical protein